MPIDGIMVDKALQHGSPLQLFSSGGPSLHAETDGIDREGTEDLTQSSLRVFEIPDGAQ